MSRTQERLIFFHLQAFFNQLNQSKETDRMWQFEVLSSITPKLMADSSQSK